MMPRRNTRTFWLIIIALIGLLIGGLAFGLSRHATQTQLNYFAERMQLLSSLRKQALENYFDTAKAEIVFWSLSDDLRRNQATLLASWDDEQVKDSGEKIRLAYQQDNPWPHDERDHLEDAGDGSDYSTAHPRFHRLARLFVTQRGYYDFFLISPDGDIFYTVQKGSDFGTNLNNSAWRKTGLANVFQRSVLPGNRDKVVISDLAPYIPSNGEPAMFMATAIRKQDGTLLGVLALQLPTDQINTIMAFTEGMGDTGETYLVGQDHILRSKSRFSAETTVLKTQVDTAPVERALADENGSMFTVDYRGTEVLSAYNSIEIDNFRWAVIAEIDRSEVLSTLAGKRPAIAGIALLLFSLALWSFWYIRPDDLTIDLPGSFDQQDAGDIPDLGD